jgi:hypothetical protein
MSDKNNAAPEQTGDVGLLQAWQRSIEAALADIGQPAKEGRAEAATLVRQMGAELTELRPLKEKVATLEARVADLEPQAKDGVAYRDATVNDAWAEYVRAGLSEGVAEADQKAIWARAPMEQLQKELAHYRKLGDARFPGGRATTDGEQPAPAAPPVPLHLYAA